MFKWCVFAIVKQAQCFNTHELANALWSVAIIDTHMLVVCLSADSRWAMTKLCMGMHGVSEFFCTASSRGTDCPYTMVWAVAMNECIVVTTIRRPRWHALAAHIVAGSRWYLSPGYDITIRVGATQI